MRRLLLISAPLMLMPLLDASPRFEFLQKYCIDCHGADKQKGNRRFDGLTENVSGIEDLEMWQEVLDLLNLGEMPPEEEKQPPLEERVFFSVPVPWLPFADRCWGTGACGVEPRRAPGRGATRS